MCWTVHPAAIADLITRLEDLAVLMWFERPIAADDEHRLVLDIASMRLWRLRRRLGHLRSGLP
jgi:L-alanine-DL-glutamate epimerase-like enolase superfamily enzyme